ncbi:MAG: molecular chaperone HtpG, partial [Flavobacteriales bacterium]|nr:molecular chaperone HtpG [Flavobacteriales bacterium]
MAKGKINVTADNIFPVIKKFLYSDHEIFLRELVSNAVDATEKLKHLSSMGEVKGDLGDTKIEISIDKDAKTLTIKDRGVGMTSEEVEKYITDIAFSGAEEFMEKYKEEMDGKDLIGHFGLGFYSAFMVASEVEIFTKSYKDGSQAVRWECDGSPEYEIEDTDKKEDRGTEIVLHIDEDSTEFLEENRITELLNKYSKFVPVEIKFGEKEETVKEGEGDDAKETKVTVDNIINNTNPAWTKAPADLTDDNYNSFYKELYPANFEDPLFHIHLNVDYPFNLTGILYFPKISKSMDIQKDKIQLYQNQVFITDNVENIVPDFLNMLKGVIDSPDIPLNVSRSYLQADAAVKRISGHITKKIADK